MRRAFPLVFAACLVSCHSATPTTNTDQKTILGIWNLVALKGQANPKGHLEFKENGSFAGEISEKEKTPKGVKMTPVSGTYTLSRDYLDDRYVLFVDMQMTSVDGKKTPADTTMRLGYDPNHHVLHDLLVFAFCRPEDETKIKQMFDKQRAARR